MQYINRNSYYIVVYPYSGKEKYPLYFSAMLVKTVNVILLTKTVDYLYDRYRLVHKWVSEMMLNV